MAFAVTQSAFQSWASAVGWKGSQTLFLGPETTMIGYCLTGAGTNSFTIYVPYINSRAQALTYRHGNTGYGRCALFYDFFEPGTFPGPFMFVEVYQSQAWGTAAGHFFAVSGVAPPTYDSVKTHSSAAGGGLQTFDTGANTGFAISAGSKSPGSGAASMTAMNGNMSGHETELTAGSRVVGASWGGSSSSITAMFLAQLAGGGRKRPQAIVLA